MTTIRRRFLLTSILGSFIAFAAFAWLVVQGRADLLVREGYGNFYDAQARALLHGHWNVAPAELFLEGFRIGGKTYTYFGVWPSVLRMPVIHFAPSLYGRLTQVSLLIAFLVATAGVVALNWRIRSILRPDAALRRGELVLVAAIPIVFGIGTSAFFLGSRAWGYHEAILWGAAWSVVAFERILAFTQRPHLGRLAAASATATLAFSSRGSVGMGPVVALGLVTTGLLLAWIRDRLESRETTTPGSIARVLGRLDWLGPRDIPPDRRGRWFLATAVAVAIPTLVYMYVNWARFGSLTSVPWSRQVYALINAKNPVLEANDGSYFGLAVAPTTLLQYFRPDALAFDGLFPWLTFAHFRTPVIGGAVVEGLDLSSSLPASMPGLTLLLVIGTVASVSTRYARSVGSRALRVPLIGAAVGVVPTILIAFIAQRYLGDFLPLLAIGALAGIHTLLARRHDLVGRARIRSTAILVGAGLLVTFGVWANGSLAVLYQRLYNPTPDSMRAGMIALQYQIDRAIGTGTHQLEQVTALPARPGRAGTTAIVGRCAGLYWSDGRAWRLVEGTPGQGVFQLRAALPPSDRHTWRPMVTWGLPGGQDVVALRRRRSTIQVSLSSRSPTGELTFNERELPVQLDPRTRHHFEVVASPSTGVLRVRVDGRDALFQDHAANLPSGTFTIGRAATPGVASVYGAPIRLLESRISACRQIRPARRSLPHQPAGVASNRNW